MPAKNLNAVKPPKLKAKTGVAVLKEPEKLDLSRKYIAAPITSPAGAQIVAEVTVLKTAHQGVVTKDQERADAKAQFDEKLIELTKAEQAHDGAIDDYARKAAKIADDDIAVLTSLGVDAAATTRAPRAEGPASAVTDIRLLEGPTSGSSTVKWPRPVGAAAFMAQYKLELPPPAPGAPPAKWLPAKCFATKNVEWSIEGLPPGAHLRVRVRAIGAEIGPWSDEVLGRRASSSSRLRRQRARATAHSLSPTGRGSPIFPATSPAQGPRAPSSHLTIKSGSVGLCLWRCGSLFVRAPQARRLPTPAPRRASSHPRWARAAGVARLAAKCIRPIVEYGRGGS